MICNAPNFFVAKIVILDKIIVYFRYDKSLRNYIILIGGRGKGGGMSKKIMDDDRGGPRSPKKR